MRALTPDPSLWSHWSVRPNKLPTAGQAPEKAEMEKEFARVGNC